MTQKAPNSTYKSSESYCSAHVWVVAIVIISLARRWVLIVLIEAMDFTQIIIKAMVLSKAMGFFYQIFLIEAMDLVRGDGTFLN